MHDFVFAFLSLPHLSILADPGQWAIYFGLFTTSFFKFLVATILAIGDSTLNFVEYFATVGGGALISVPVYTFFGDQVRKFLSGFSERFFSNNKGDEEKEIRQQKKRARRQKFWNRYGLFGVALVAPFISPMISVGIAVSFKEKPWRIILFVGLSVIIWTFIFFLLREQMLGIASRLNLLQ